MVLTAPQVEQALKKVERRIRVRRVPNPWGYGPSTLITPRTRSDALPTYSVSVNDPNDPKTGRVEGPVDHLEMWWSEEFDQPLYRHKYWVGVKWYRNVSFSWFSKSKSLPEKWHRIDELLTKLEAH